MLQQYKKEDDVVWRKFIRVNLLKSTLINLIFNTLYPYFNIKNLDTVYLFDGKYCFARFLLPMVFLLPFMITFDMLKKSIAIAEQENAGFTLPANSRKYKFIFRIAGINGGVTLFVTLSVMLCVHLNLPKNYYFDGRLLSVLMGILAGLLAMLFTLWPIQKIRSMRFV